MRKTAFLCMFSVLAFGCVSLENDDRVAWLQNGSFSIMKPAPSAADPRAFSLPGFIPSTAGAKGSWLSINTKSGEISLMEDEKVSYTANAALEELSVKPGTYSIAHKQRNPLWHADEKYFTSRNLPVPQEGERARFLRGALGDFALFVDDETPIHSGPVYTEEVGGIRISDIQMSKIYYSIPVGARVDVK